MNAIVGRLGLDTKPLSSDLNRAVSEVNAAGKKMQQGMNAGAAGGEHLLASSHRVARQVQNVTKDLLSGADAATVFSAGLEGLERSLHLPLGSLLGLGVGAIAVEKLHEIVAEGKKLIKELDEVGERGNGAKSSSDNDAAIAAGVALAKKADEMPRWKRWLASVFSSEQPHSALTDAWSLQRTGKLAAGKTTDGVMPETVDLVEEAKRKAFEDRIANERDKAAEMRMRNTVESAHISEQEKEFALKGLEFQEKILATRGNAILSAPIHEEWQTWNKNFAEKIADKNRYSLAELSQKGPDSVEGWRGGSKGVAIDGQMISVREAARRAEEEKAEAERLKLSGANPDMWHGENWHRSRYDQLTNGMGNMLKNEDKTMDQFKGALDNATVLKNIETNTQKMFSHQ